MYIPCGSRLRPLSFLHSLDQSASHFDPCPLSEQNSLTLLPLWCIAAPHTLITFVLLPFTVLNLTFIFISSFSILLFILFQYIAL